MNCNDYMTQTIYDIDCWLDDRISEVFQILLRLGYENNKRTHRVANKFAHIEYYRKLKNEEE